MADAKAVVSAVDFMAAVGGKTEIYTVDGITVELRSLHYEEAEALMAEYSNKPAAMLYQMFVRGIAKPELTEAQRAQLRQAHPSFVQKIGGRVAELSGLSNPDGDSPLAGGGS